MRHVILFAVMFSLLTVVVPFAQPSQSSCCPTPHTRTLRVAAEWEPVVGVLIGWPLQLPRDLVREMAREVDLHVTVRNEWARRHATHTFQKWGIDPTRVHFTVTGQGTGYYLPRDWGPYAVFDADGTYRLVDGELRDYPLSGITGAGYLSLASLFRLNYRRDDQATAAFAQAMRVQRQELPIALTGGNVAFDGHGTGFASELLLQENNARGVSREQFLDTVKNQLGTPRFHFLPNFERFGIQHIDCLFKLLDEERILVKRTPPDHPAHDHVENVVRHLQQLTNPRGRRYQILRIDTPCYLWHKLATYTNSLIVNRKIYVPLFDIPGDKAALETWRRAMPGYEVMGFSYRGWSFTDALHCRVRGVWDPCMLYLSHHRPECRVPWSAKFPLTLQVRDYSKAGLLAEGLTLSWRVSGSTDWQVTPLRPGNAADTFQAEVSGITPGQTLEYFFSAASASGRRETMPRTAPRAVYSVTVG